MESFPYFVIFYCISIPVSTAENDPEYLVDNATVARIYDKQRGIQAVMLSFKRNDGLYKLEKGDYNKVSRFASVPKFLEFRVRS